MNIPNPWEDSSAREPLLKTGRLYETPLSTRIRALAAMKQYSVARLCKKILSCRGIRSITPDSWYLKALYRVKVGRKLDLHDPKTFNEKMQWLKLNVREPFLTKLVDKYEVRGYVASTIGQEFVVPLVGGPWSRFDEIDFDALPDKFVLKCTHDSGGLVVCSDRKTFDAGAARLKLERALRRNFYWAAREAPYRDVPPRLIAEEYLESDDEEGLRDYKFFVFNGRVRMIIVCSGRFGDEGLHVTSYDDQWNMLPFDRKYPREAVAEPRPEAFDKLRSLAEKLAGDLIFARIDFYLNKGRIYVGEITLYPGAGLEPFSPEEWDATVGGWLDLSKARGRRSHERLKR